MTDVLDRSRMAAIAHGSGVTQAAILAEFLRVNAADAALLREAARQGDAGRVALLTHRIAGASLMLGASRLALACSALAAASGAADAAGVTTALVSLAREIACLDKELDALGAGTAGAAGSAPAGGVEGPALLCSNLRFLVVEDHDFQRSVIVRLLRRLGAREVLDFGDGAAALQALGDPATRSDIMVLDLAMPGMNGMELMQTIGAARLPVSIIMNSAVGLDLLSWPVQTARSYGVTVLGAVSKPLTEADLAPLIALHRSRAPA